MRTAKDDVVELNDATSRTDLAKWAIEEGRVAHHLATHYPDAFLCYESIGVGVKPNWEILTIGLFKCGICGRPISHQQFAFSRLCGSCDVGKTNPKWIIQVPSEIRNKILEDAELEKLREENAQLRKRVEKQETTSSVDNQTREGA